MNHNLQQGTFQGTWTGISFFFREELKEELVPKFSKGTERELVPNFWGTLQSLVIKDMKLPSLPVISYVLHFSGKTAE